MIDPKLETFLEACATGSFTKAAQRMSLTQPAVSQHIRQLEREVGAKLFNRREGGMQLTPEGEIVRKYARRIQVLYQNMAQTLLDEKHRVTRITVGVTHTAESNVIAEVLAQYCNENPGIRITIISDAISNLYAKMKTYELDLAIVEGKIADANFNSILLDTDSLILAVAPGHPLAKKSMVTLEELRRQKLILRLPDSATRHLFASHLASNNVSLEDLDVVLEVDNIATIKDLVRQNFGVSILAKSVFQDEIRKGKLVGLPVENLSMIREISIVYHRDFEHAGILDEITRLYYQMVRAQ